MEQNAQGHGGVTVPGGVKDCVFFRIPITVRILWENMQCDKLLRMVTELQEDSCKNNFQFLGMMTKWVA